MTAFTIALAWAFCSPIVLGPIDRHGTWPIVLASFGVAIVLFYRAQP